MEAAVAIEPNAGTLLRQVLSLLRWRKAYGATDEEMQDHLKMNPSTQRPRRVELVNRKLVVDSGRTRLTRSGRKATVWVAT
jgi:transcription initiation factor IIE alpha subunit